MITESDKLKIREIAVRYKAKRLLLFGSSASATEEGVDIDLAVEGISPGHFFDFYADLIFGLSKPVDLIDLSRDSKFTRLVRKTGIPLTNL